MCMWHVIVLLAFLFDDDSMECMKADPLVTGIARYMAQCSSLHFAALRLVPAFALLD